MGTAAEYQPGCDPRVIKTYAWVQPHFCPQRNADRTHGQGEASVHRYEFQLAQCELSSAEEEV